MNESCITLAPDEPVFLLDLDRFIENASQPVLLGGFIATAACALWVNGQAEQKIYSDDYSLIVRVLARVSLGLVNLSPESDCNDFGLLKVAFYAASNYISQAHADQKDFDPSDFYTLQVLQ